MLTFLVRLLLQVHFYPYSMSAFYMHVNDNSFLILWSCTNPFFIESQTDNRHKSSTGSFTFRDLNINDSTPELQYSDSVQALDHPPIKCC